MHTDVLYGDVYRRADKTFSHEPRFLSVSSVFHPILESVRGL